MAQLLAIIFFGVAIQRAESRLLHGDSKQAHGPYVDHGVVNNGTSEDLHDFVNSPAAVQEAHGVYNTRSDHLRDVVNSSATVQGLAAVAGTGDVAAGWGTVEILDVNTECVGCTWRGGFTDGTYGYLVPSEDHRFPNHDTVARFSLSDFTQNGIETLDLATVGSDVKGFFGGFVAGAHGYLLPRTRGPGYVNHGKVVRFPVADFSTSSVQVLDVATVDSDLVGFRGGFSDGTHGYMTPDNSCRGSKVARFALSDFSVSSVQVLNLASFDSELAGFINGFSDGTFGYLVPYYTCVLSTGAGYFGKLVRFSLSQFSLDSIEILDLTTIDSDLKGFSSGFMYGDYGYLVPWVNGKVVRFSLSHFSLSAVEILDVATVDSEAAYRGTGFTDGTYGYLLPTSYRKFVRFSLSDFSLDTVEVWDLTGVYFNPSHRSQFMGSFTDGVYGYGLPSYDAIGRARVARFLVAGLPPSTSPAQPTPTPAPAASATGDPHLQNIHGERFDLMRPGNAVLIQIPRGHTVEKALLTVEADARRLGSQCADMYFQSLNITGAWADKVRAGGLTFTAAGSRDETLQIPGWTQFGPLKLKVAHGRTSQGIEYLNFYVKHLREAGAAVGGLLGEDDYTEAATPEEGCRKAMSLDKKAISTSDVGRTEAIASLA